MMPLLLEHRLLMGLECAQEHINIYYLYTVIELGGEGTCSKVMLVLQ